MRHLIVLALAAAVSLAGGSAAEAAKRVALLIGNAAYAHTGALKNPLNDAAAMETRLQALGFEIERVGDAGRLDMARAIKRFGQRSRTAETALVFYSGHGMEVGGRNYLIPTDAELQREDDADLEAIPLESAIAAAAGASQLSVVIVDACRNNQFPSSSRSGAKGFAAVGARPGQVIAFATAPGQVAYDGDRDLSPFTQALTEALETTPSEDIRILMTTLGAATERYAGAAQQPFTRIGDMPPGKRVALTGITDLSAGAPASAPEETPAAEAPSGDGSIETASNAAPSEETATRAPEPEAAPEPIPSETVWEAQRLLEAMGYYKGGVDGDWGGGSVAAYNAFARDNGLPADGRPNASSLALMRVLAEQAEAERAKAAQEAALAEEQARAAAAERAEAARRAEAEAAREAQRRAEEAAAAEAARQSRPWPDGSYRGRSRNIQMGVVFRGGKPTTGSITVSVNGRPAVTPMRFTVDGRGWIRGTPAAPHPQVRVLDLAGRMPQITVKLLANGQEIRETVRFPAPR